MRTDFNIGIGDFSKYENRIPLYLRNSFGYVDLFKTFYDVANNICTEGSSILYGRAIYDSGYLTWLRDLRYNETSSIATYGEYSDFLDTLGSMWGVERKFSVTVSGTTTNFDLDNEKYLLLIKAQIIKNRFNSTVEDALKLYERIGLSVKIFHGYYADGSGGRMHLVLDNDDTDIRIMFNAGLFDLKIAGIETAHTVDGYDYTQNGTILTINNAPYSQQGSDLTII